MHVLVTNFDNFGIGAEIHRFILRNRRLYQNIGLFFQLLAAVDSIDLGSAHQVGHDGWNTLFPAKRDHLAQQPLPTRIIRCKVITGKFILFWAAIDADHRDHPGSAAFIMSTGKAFITPPSTNTSPC